MPDSYLNTGLTGRIPDRNFWLTCDLEYLFPLWQHAPERVQSNPVLAAKEWNAAYRLFQVRMHADLSRFRRPNSDYDIIWTHYEH